MVVVTAIGHSLGLMPPVQGTKVRVYADFAEPPDDVVLTVGDPAGNVTVRRMSENDGGLTDIRPHPTVPGRYYAVIDTMPSAGV